MGGLNFFWGSQKFFWGSKFFFGGSKKISEISDFLTKNRKKKSGGIKNFFGKIPDFSKKIEKKWGYPRYPRLYSNIKEFPLKNMGLPDMIAPNMIPPDMVTPDMVTPDRGKNFLGIYINPKLGHS